MNNTKAIFATAMKFLLVLFLSLPIGLAIADDDENAGAQIITVLVNHPEDGQITILGEGLEVGESLVVTLGDSDPLTILSASADMIQVECPPDTNGDPTCEAGDRLLIVAADTGGDDDDEEGGSAQYDLTIGAAGGGGRIATFTVDESSSCNYSCSAEQPAPKCDCFAFSSTFGEIVSCSCFSEATASCTEDSCLAGPISLSCPDVGGAQGQSALANCIGGTLTSGGTCDVPQSPASGPTVSCSQFVLAECQRPEPMRSSVPRMASLSH